MGLENAPHITAFADSGGLQRLEPRLEGRLWLVVSVPLEPFSVIMRLPVTSYRNGIVRCSLERPCMSPGTRSMQEMAAFYLSQSYPVKKDQKPNQIGSIRVKEPVLEVTLLDERWPDTVHTILNAHACSLAKDSSATPMMDFYFNSSIPLSPIIDTMNIQISALEETPQSQTSTRAS